MLIIDDSELDRAITKAFYATAQTLAAASVNQLESSVWQWPRFTQRRNGEIAGLVRDRVDTGALRDADRLDLISPDRADIVNDAPYASAVALGTSRMPGTNWMTAAVEAVDPLETFTKALRKQL